MLSVIPILVAQATANSTLLPAWAIAGLLWGNGFMVATIVALFSRQRGIDVIKVGLETQITGARAAVEAMIREEAARRSASFQSYDGRLDQIEREVFGRNGLAEQLKRVNLGVSSLVNLFLRHGARVGIAPEDLRELEEHR